MKTGEDEETKAPVDKWTKSLVFLTSITGSKRSSAKPIPSGVLIGYWLFVVSCWDKSDN